MATGHHSCLVVGNSHKWLTVLFFPLIDTWLRQDLAPLWTISTLFLWTLFCFFKFPLQGRRCDCVNSYSLVCPSALAWSADTTYILTWQFTARKQNKNSLHTCRSERAHVRTHTYLGSRTLQITKAWCFVQVWIYISVKLVPTHLPRKGKLCTSEAAVTKTAFQTEDQCTQALNATWACQAQEG